MIDFFEPLRVKRRLAAVAFAVAGLLLIQPAALAQEQSSAPPGETFASPDIAIQALVASIRSGTADDILKVLGSDATRMINSGDAAADQASRAAFLASYDDSHRISLETDARAVLIVGKDDFPFPIPVIRANSSWRFDTQAGEAEVLSRRIGRNELSAIETMQAFVAAQREYAMEDRDGAGLQYAQHLLSSEGAKDGLYWPANDDEPESPLGPLIADARAEGYAPQAGQPSPYHGYVFRILTSQGPAAAGGAMEYVVDNRMIAGFALLAIPAEYGNSGVMSFIVNHDGVVFEADLGPDTSQAAAEILQFNPDAQWSKIKAD
jgi:hypothetical protein